MNEIKRYKVEMLLLLFMVGSCSSSKQTISGDADRISLGSFGGFAGAFKEYIISSDGKLYIRKKQNATKNQLAQLDESVLIQFSTTLERLSTESPEVNNPGNMTYFIRFHNDGAEPVEWIWGGGQRVNPQVNDVYSVLSKLCRSHEHPIR